MLTIQILCVGKLKEAFYIAGAAEYQKRLSPYCKLEITEVPEARRASNPSPGEIRAALEKEAAAIREKLIKGATVVALCIEGKQTDSPGLARLLEQAAGTSSRLSFLIGGSDGLHDSIKAMADIRLSMSPMTFPHHLARVMLLEQIYRGFKINEGSRYHK